MIQERIPDWDHQYRIISSEFPPINFFETLVESELMEELYLLESMTNDRLRQEVGDIGQVAPEDRTSGPGSSVVMAAFTHVGIESRFSDGSYGVYYAANSVDAAIAETKFHRERFLSYTSEVPGEIDMRVYIGEVRQPCHDIRNGFHEYHDSDVASWPVPQAFGREVRETNGWGIIYRSVRHADGECIAALRPPAVTIPRQGPHLSYVWDGSGINKIYEKRIVN